MAKDLNAHFNRIGVDPRVTLAIPVDVALTRSFVSNMRQTLDSVSFGKKRIEWSLNNMNAMQRLMGICDPYVRGTGFHRDFSSTRDGIISVVDNLGFADIYLLQSIQQSGAADDPSITNLKTYLFQSRGSMARLNYPNLEVSVLDEAGDIIDQSVINGFSLKSSDGRAFTTATWNLISNGVDFPWRIRNGGGWQTGCFAIYQTRKIFVYLKYEPEKLVGSTIKIRMVTP